MSRIVTYYRLTVLRLLDDGAPKSIGTVEHYSQEYLVRKARLILLRGWHKVGPENLAVNIASYEKEIGFNGH